MTDLADSARLLRTQGVTAPAGFRATGIAAGIKASGALDLALVFNEGPDHAARVIAEHVTEVDAPVTSTAAGRTVLTLAPESWLALPATLTRL